MWIWIIWLKIQSSCELLWTRERTRRLRKIRGTSWLAEKLSASQEWLYSTGLVSYLAVHVGGRQGTFSYRTICVVNLTSADTRLLHVLGLLWRVSQPRMSVTCKKKKICPHGVWENVKSGQQCETVGTTKSTFVFPRYFFPAVQNGLQVTVQGSLRAAKASTVVHWFVA